LFVEKRNRVNLQASFKPMTHLDFIAQQLTQQSIAVVDDAFDSDMLTSLREEAMNDYMEGEFHAARIGKGIEKQRIQEVRSDRVKWHERSQASEALERYWSWIDTLRMHLSEYFRVHMERTEMHFAVYPKGAFYAPHYDQFRETSNRVFSVILYLNPSWQAGDGGELRVIRDDGSTEEFAPLHGRLICFRSDVVLHEVLETSVPRISLTGWMRRDPLIF
jgi:SM-20-related protein